MIVYDNQTMRNMRFCILLNETELAILRVAMEHITADVENFEDPTIEDLKHLSHLRRIHKTLENPIVKPRKGTGDAEPAATD